MTPNVLILRYASFAVLATAANLAIQRLILFSGTTGVHFALALVCGTLVGLVIKYLLDKRWIFFDDETGLRAHGQKFTLYAVMGLITTALFWGTETAFWLIWQSTTLREVGAVLGLFVGYVVKYNLDRRFVFNSVWQRATA